MDQYITSDTLLIPCCNSNCSIHDLLVVTLVQIAVRRTVLREGLEELRRSKGAGDQHERWQ